MVKAGIIFVTGAALLAVHAEAWSQTLEQRGFEPVGQITDDTDPLQKQLRRVEGGMRTSGGQNTFVYRRAGLSAGKPAKLYYIAPGVVAEYDRSDYGWFEVKKDEYWILQKIPPNTLFHIGLPPAEPAILDPERQPPLRLQRRVNRRVDARAADAPVEGAELGEAEGESNAAEQQTWQRYREFAQVQRRAVLETLDHLDDAPEVSTAGD